MGNYLGVRVWGGFGNESVLNIDVDSLGNVYVLGTFQGAVDFDPDSVIEDWHSSIDTDAPFICKYDSAGNDLWTITWGTATGQCMGLNMIIDNSDNIYVAGIFNELVDLNPGPAEDMHFAIAHRSNVFFSKLDSNGNYILGKSWGNTLDDAATAIEVDDSGYVYITGFFTGGVDFDPDPVYESLLASVGQADPYITKFDSLGNHIYAYSWGGGAQFTGTGISVDNSGSVYVNGIFEGTIDLDPTWQEDLRVGTPGENRFMIKCVTTGIATDGQSDALVHSSDGIDLWWRYMPEFATYQTFTALIE